MRKTGRIESDRIESKTQLNCDLAAKKEIKALAADQLGNTSSRMITEVKQQWAQLVLEWETVQVLTECCCQPCKVDQIRLMSYSGC